MYLVLGSDEDPSAAWACAGLRERLDGVEWVSAADLGRAARWEHRVGAEGASVEVALADGRTIRGGDVRGVLNRLLAQPPAAGAHPEDAEYAGQELAAFYLSWLHALPAPMLGRPAPFALCGAWRDPLEWTWLAARSGLPTAEYRVPLPPDLSPRARRTSAHSAGPEQRARGEGENGSDRTKGPNPPPGVFGGGWASNASPGGGAPEAWNGLSVFVVGDEIIGPNNLPLRRGCRKLAELAGVTLLGVTFTGASRGGWAFAGATPLPDLTSGGDTLLDALARALRRGREAADA